MGLTDEESGSNPAPDAFVQFGGLARETDDLGLVMLVSPITFRHPAVLAKMAVTLDRMSGGRFSLGVGTGWMDREHEVFGFEYPDTKERFEHLEEALGYIQAAFDPTVPGFQGDRYKLESFPISPAPLGKIPIVVGGTGRSKTPRLAGQFADEFNVYPGPGIGDRLERFRVAAVEAGRDPDAVLLSSSGQVIATETREELDEIMDQKASDSRVSREELDAYYEKRQTPMGTYEQVREILDDFAALGIERFYFQGAFSPETTGRLLDGLGIGQPAG
jgi:alkanesulfonate monooxygenase SsuD/methylene tetrahydromethanopterin reductase-like flavin-dependent oxidoreductase (luciferase family)